MTGRAVAMYTYAEDFPSVPEHLEQAWLTAQSAGCEGITPAVGTVMRCLASAIAARHIVDISDGDLCGLWALAGAPHDAIVTTVLLDATLLDLVQEAYAHAGIASQRRRFMPGAPLDALCKLTDSAYDLVVISGRPSDLPAYVDQALRLLRPGGMMIVMGVLAAGRVAEPTCRDADAVLLREVLRHVREDPRLTPMVVPLGTGLLVAVREHTEAPPTTNR